MGWNALGLDVGSLHRRATRRRSAPRRWRDPPQVPGPRVSDGLPVLSGGQLVKALGRAGWHTARQKGSHVRRPDGRRAAVATALCSRSATLISMSITIPQRELRNQISDVLRRAEHGERFTITVGGRPVAELGPLTSARRPAAPDRLTVVLTGAPPDTEWSAQLRQMRDEDIEATRDPWAA
jgi:prevent-host-death family protein